ncbi:hypothetical protein CEXT_54371 [Caerostris extrusa]|uniref:Uncharacterized protein n=1 Tax=Caerostris extrusa TaxID=172846 RepID=A0AAV4USN8_CAEEX|nr:hypothetical protein CEXT_54371 [Caerostris extrusa]
MKLPIPPRLASTSKTNEVHPSTPCPDPIRALSGLPPPHSSGNRNENCLNYGVLGVLSRDAGLSVQGVKKGGIAKTTNGESCHAWRTGISDNCSCSSILEFGPTLSCLNRNHGGHFGR